MSRLWLVFVLILAALQCCLPQIIRVIEVPVRGRGRGRELDDRFYRNVQQPDTQQDSRYGEENQVIFEFLKPRGLGIIIPGPYPPSRQYKLKFHININKEFDGWKLGEWNEGISVKYGAKWRHTFPNIQVKEGDVIYYWIEAEGDDWEKGYKGKYQVGEQSMENRIPTNCPRGSTTSVTTYSGGRTACSGEKLIRSYSQVDQKYLRDESPIFMRSIKQIGGLDPEEEFTVFTAENIIINRTHTALFPGLLEVKYGPSFVNSQDFTIKGCTSDVPQLCRASAMAYLILPPILSGRHSSEKSFSFRYGTVEVTAKLPSGDWVVPEMWLLPKDRAYNWTDDSTVRIVLGMARGNEYLRDGVHNIGNQEIQVGVQRASGDVMFTKSLSRPWSDRYHRFKLVWTPDKLEFLIDDEQIGIIEADSHGLDPSIAPFDQEFYLVFGVHVGGNRDFPDSIDSSKPWRNFEPKSKLKFWQARGQWQPTWGIQTALVIRDLKVTAL